MPINIRDNVYDIYDFMVYSRFSELRYRVGKFMLLWLPIEPMCDVTVHNFENVTWRFTNCSAVINFDSITMLLLVSFLFVPRKIL